MWIYNLMIVNAFEVLRKEYLQTFMTIQLFSPGWIKVLVRLM